VDCRACQKSKGCVIDDKMKLIYEDDFDNVVIASPLYISNLTHPLFAIASRFQAYYCAKRFLKDAFILRKKKSALILVGGGDGGYKEAVRLSDWIFKKLNAFGYKEHMALSLETDSISARYDTKAIEQVEAIADYLNSAAI
jgi:multimeric flavodoxin WrbA